MYKPGEGECGYTVAECTHQASKRASERHFNMAFSCFGDGVDLY